MKLIFRFYIYDNRQDLKPNWLVSRKRRPRKLQKTQKQRKKPKIRRAKERRRSKWCILFDFYNNSIKCLKLEIVSEFNIFFYSSKS